MNPLVQAIHAVSPLSTEAREAFSAIVGFERFPKNTELLRIGQVAHRMYFLHSGLGRVYYYKDEVDVTDYFAMDHQFIGAVPSLFTGQPSRKGIQLLEDSEVYYFTIRDMEALFSRYHELKRAGRRMMIFGFLEVQARVESIQFLSARERYDELDRQYPGLLNRAPLKHVASYLGITQVSLSRIRRKG